MIESGVRPRGRGYVRAISSRVLVKRAAERTLTVRPSTLIRTDLRSNPPTCLAAMDLLGDARQ
jgi:hypothetical protein